MRRAPIVLTTTVAGLVGVLSFHARDPARVVVAAAGAAPTTGAATTTTPAPATTPAAAGGTQTVDGDAIDTQYGPAQVRVTITAGRIADVQALQLQANEPKSVEISGYAAPLLRQSALARQSAALDVVSGATFTSVSYEASLQSALDKAGFTAAAAAQG